MASSATSLRLPTSSLQSAIPSPVRFRSTNPESSRMSARIDDWDKEDEESFEVPEFYFDWGVAKDKPKENSTTHSRATSLEPTRSTESPRDNGSRVPSLTQDKSSHPPSLHTSSTSSLSSPQWPSALSRGAHSSHLRSASNTDEGPSSGSSGGSAKIYGKRAFTRVVSAPIDRSASPKDESTTLTAVKQDATLRPAVAHITSASLESSDTWTTPGLTHRILPRTAVSTSRRIAGLSRFGGPARRVAVPQDDDEAPVDGETDAERHNIDLSPHPTTPPHSPPQGLRRQEDGAKPMSKFRSSPPPPERLMAIPRIPEEAEESYSPSAVAGPSRRVPPVSARGADQRALEQENKRQLIDSLDLNGAQRPSRVMAPPLHPAMSVPNVQHVQAIPEKSASQPVIVHEASRPAPAVPRQEERSVQDLTNTQVLSASSKKSFVVNGSPYERISLLGRGGSSRVYSVLCPTKRTIYALKRVALDKADEETYRSYTNEIELLRRLKGHDRVIQLMDFQILYSAANRPKVLMMVMECGEIDFSALLDEQRGKPVNMNFVGLYWEQMLQAVQAVHCENVVHTDLKPANFVLVKGRLKIIDFGIAKAIANDTVNIQRDEQVGTVNYMSPEAIQRMNNQKVLKLSYPSDVWSLGCILYQMIYGNPPFHHITGGPLPKMAAIANPSHTIAYPTSVQPQTATLQGSKDTDHALRVVRVPASAIDTMKRCLAYRKEDRLTIPELLEHPFLNVQTDGLPPNSTSITSAQMRVLVNWILEQRGCATLSATDHTAEDLFDQLKTQNSG